MTTASIDKRKRTSILTPAEHKALLLKQLATQKRNTLTDYLFGKIKSWNDFSRSAGFTAPVELLAVALTKDAIKMAFDRKIQLVESGAELLEKPSAEKSLADNVLDDTDDGNKYYVPEYRDISDHKNSKVTHPIIVYKAFQERACWELIQQLTVKKHLACALNAGVGSGKTFIFAAMLKHLWNIKWEPLVSSISPYPAVIVTRATVVTQTERVCYNKLGLKRGREVDVTNIDQFRSKFGEQFVRDRIVHDFGEEKHIYEWHPYVAPALIVLDESQSVKNPDSEQSKIMQAFNDIDDGGVHAQVHSSATMFTRVCEAKVFAVATRLEW